MKLKRFGFTLIEISLFLAITGLLFVGIIVGTGNSIAQQRFTDSVQSFAELLRSIYSEVSNPQSVGEGRSDVAIYGKLISFGQTVGLDGNEIDARDQRVFVYDVVGGTKEPESGETVSSLRSVDANVVVINESEVVEPAGEVQSYTPRWGASIETTTKGEMFVGSILVVRHPRSGTINTLIYSGESGIVNVNEKIVEANRAASIEEKRSIIKGILKLNECNGGNGYCAKVVDFCVNPSGIEVKTDWRRDIRLIKNSRNASGVEVIDMDLNKLDDNGEQIGNRCRF